MNIELLLHVYLWGLTPAGIFAGIIWGYVEITNYQLSGSRPAFLCILVGLIIFWPFWLVMFLWEVTKR